MKKLPKSLGHKSVRRWDLSETNKRSLVKTISWRVVGSTSAVIISLAVTGSIAIASTIGILHLISNTILYFFHERFWNKINWGKHEV